MVSHLVGIHVFKSHHMFIFPNIGPHVSMNDELDLFAYRFASMVLHVTVGYMLDLFA